MTRSQEKKTWQEGNKRGKLNQRWAWLARSPWEWQSQVWSEEGIESGVGWTPGKEDQEASLARVQHTAIWDGGGGASSSRQPLTYLLQHTNVQLLLGMKDTEFRLRSLPKKRCSWFQNPYSSPCTLPLRETRDEEPSSKAASGPPASSALPQTIKNNGREEIKRWQQWQNEDLRFARFRRKSQVEKGVSD